MRPNCGVRLVKPHDPCDVKPHDPCNVKPRNPSNVKPRNPSNVNLHNPRSVVPFNPHRVSTLGLRNKKRLIGRNVNPKRRGEDNDWAGKSEVNIS